ncbi:hypothetical protein [Aliidiomarina celeris]|uniref:hypothetical protein n=1 Tax=Aliidiomarina celeris TaxID=2249428 RepID=UPI0018E5FA6F|nr:hypothetical protein [Aliidiomarina celeris]
MRFLTQMVTSLFLLATATNIGVVYGGTVTPHIETMIVNKVIAAYGGDALLHATHVKVVDYNKGPWPGEGESPEIPELWRINEELVIDFKNQRKSLLSYRVPRTTLDLEKWIQEGNTTVVYDILHERYAEENWANFDRLGASLERSSDTLQAKRLANLAADLEYQGDEYFRGRLQHKLGLTHASGERYTYFIDSTSGLIHKILRQHPRAGELLYVFSNHKTEGQVAFARDMNFFVNGELRLISVHRDFVIEPDLPEAFSRFTHFTPWGETFDSSEFTSKKLADGVYQAGTGRALTVFLEQADHYIALGAADALEENFAAITELSMQEKPLKYFVVTHHHNANLRGLDNAVAMGATLVVAEQHAEVILGSLSAELDKAQLHIVPSRTPFDLGNLKLFDIATAHAQHYLLAYLPSAKMVIAEDHYVTALQTAKPRIYHDMVRFAHALAELNLDIDTLIDIRGWRQFSMKEFTEWTTEFTPKSCPAGYKICAHG